MTKKPKIAYGKGPKLQIAVPPKFHPLFDFEGDACPRWRYYVFYGGRDSAKSWTVAQAVIAACINEPVRVLCTREIQRSIAESVHQLLRDTIERMGLSALFEVQEKRIICLTTGAMIIYHGLRDLNVASIKSFEGIDIVWVEEGHKVTKMSWNTLINTIRAPQSEIWVTFNPELDTDETYRRFVLRPPSDAFVQKVTFEDNAMRSAVLESERRRMQEQDPDEYDNVYLGNPRSAVIGAIYEREIAQLIQSRFRPVPYDPQLLVHTAWDLGWNDQTTIIFAQRLISEVRIIDYEEASFQRADQWADRLAQRGYAYGGHWLPHDADHETLAGGGVSLKKQLRSLFAQARVGGQLHVIPRVPDENQRIRAARQMFPRVYMDSDKCERLLECLRRFRRAKPETTGEEGAPVKDEYKHGADAFGELARIVDKLGNELQPKMVFRQHRISNPRIGY